MKRTIPESCYDWCNFEFIVLHGDVATEGLELADKVHRDLIALGAQKASCWLTHVESGLTPELLAHTRCQVMTIC